MNHIGTPGMCYEYLGIENQVIILGVRTEVSSIAGCWRDDKKLEKNFR